MKYVMHVDGDDRHKPQVSFRLQMAGEELVVLQAYVNDGVTSSGWKTVARLYNSGEMVPEVLGRWDGR